MVGQGWGQVDAMLGCRMRLKVLSILAQPERWWAGAAGASSLRPQKPLTHLSSRNCMGTQGTSGRFSITSP